MRNLVYLPLLALLLSSACEGSDQIVAPEGATRTLGASAPDSTSAPPDSTSPPPSPWDVVLQDTTIQGDVVVPAGQTWLIGRNVQIAGNLRTDSGTIAMRPGSTLKFLGASPDLYVGGGMGFEPLFANDIGLWIGSGGVLDIQCTPKTGWNRTGSDPTWLPGDEYWISPTAAGDYTPRRWYPGNAVPRVDPRVPAAEVMNVTRDCVVEGPGHIHIHSQRPQQIAYVQLRSLGVSNTASGGPVLGRYALHLHHGRDGTRGTIIRGVAAVDSRGRVLVPHESHGITVEDFVSVNSHAEVLWWDEGDRSNDLSVDRLAASGVTMPRTITNSTSRFDAVVLGGGTNLRITNSVASGVRGGSGGSAGFHWPSKVDNAGPAVWTFEDNVAHNNITGIRLWFNNRAPHEMRRFVTYRNKDFGIENGAYSNSHRWFDGLLVDDVALQHASSKPREDDGQPARFERIEIYRTSGPAIEIGRLRAAGQDRMEFIDCTLQPGPGAAKVHVSGRNQFFPFVALFRRCGVLPADILFDTPFAPGLAGSNVLIEDASGARWEITLDMATNTKIVKQLP